MDRTRASLRRARVYAAILAVCAAYAAAPWPCHDTLIAHTSAAVSRAAEWVQSHLQRGPR